MAGSTTLQQNPAFLNARTNIYTAWPLRNFQDGDPPGPGVADYESFRVKQRGAGANLSADLGNTSLNQAWIRGTTRDGQGLYRADNIDYTAPTANTFLAQFNTGVIFSANDPTNARIDQVFLRILDTQHDAGGSSLLTVQVVDGTPTGGATLDNRTGVGAVPANSILLADVLMPGGGASQVLTANIRDRRPRPLNGDVPVPSGVGTAVDMVSFQPCQGLQAGLGKCEDTAGSNALGGAALMYLPRRIVAATRIRWKYAQGATSNATNYAIAIYDASGRIKLANDGVSLVSTGAVAYAGVGNTFAARSETIPATTFEPGWYYVMLCNATGTASASVTTWGVNGNIFAATSAGPSGPNMFIGVSVGSTPPTTLAAGADQGTAVAGSLYITVPIVSLSVG